MYYFSSFLLLRLCVFLLPLSFFSYLFSPPPHFPLIILALFFFLRFLLLFFYFLLFLFCSFFSLLFFLLFFIFFTFFLLFPYISIFILFFPFASSSSSQFLRDHHDCSSAISSFPFAHFRFTPRLEIHGPLEMEARKANAFLRNPTKATRYRTLLPDESTNA